MHTAAALVQALRSQENHLPGPPKGAPSYSQCQTDALSNACLSCISATEGSMRSVIASQISLTVPGKDGPQCTTFVSSSIHYCAIASVLPGGPQTMC